MSSGKNEVLHGTFQLSESERKFLTKESGCKFQRHPKIDGVQIRQLELKRIPKGIWRVLNDMAGVPSQFLIVKATKGIPFHLHVDEAELCFGGSGGVAIFVNNQKEEIGRFDLRPNFYSVVEVDNWHGTVADQEVIFYGVKFVEKRWCICQVEKVPAFFGKIEKLVRHLIYVRTGSGKNDSALCSASQIKRFVSAEEMLEEFSRIPGNNPRKAKDDFSERFPAEGGNLSI